MPRHKGFDWPDVPATLTPLAYTRNAVPDVLVPVYPPGLSLMMAPLTLIHANAVFLLVPLCAALTVWLTVVLGRELTEPSAGVLGALLVAVSPTFLLQAAQPMSDVPVAALWLSALVLARRPSTAAAILAGVASSLAILVRPNLAPLLLLVAAACATGRRAPDRPDVASSRGNPPLARAIWLLLAAMPGVVALGAIQAVRYGSPLGSGYGSFDDLFALSNVAPNLARYPRWMTETHTPLIWLWLLAPLSFPLLDRGARAFGWILYSFAVAVVLAYLPYVYFQPGRMDVHAVSAARPAGDDGPDRAGAVERGTAHRTACTGRNRSRRLCRCCGAVDVAARRRSRCSACAKASRSIPASAASSASSCRRPHS